MTSKTVPFGQPLKVPSSPKHCILFCPILTTARATPRRLAQGRSRKEQRDAQRSGRVLLPDLTSQRRFGIEPTGMETGGRRTRPPRSSTSVTPTPGFLGPRPLRCSACSTALLHGDAARAHAGAKLCTACRNCKSRHSLWPLSISIIKIVILEVVLSGNQAAAHQSIISLRPTNKQTGTSVKSRWTWTNSKHCPKAERLRILFISPLRPASFSINF